MVHQQKPVYVFGQITTVPLKWTNRSLKSLKWSLLRVVLRVHGFEFENPQHVTHRQNTAQRTVRKDLFQ